MKKDPKTEIDPGIIDEALESVEKRSSNDKGSNLKEDKKEAAESSADAMPPAQELYDRLLRVTADFENFRKRTQKEKSDLVRYGNEHLLREILPIMDNFERAVEHAQKASDVESIRTGVTLILSQLSTTLERLGVKTQRAIGQSFDPLVHEAVNHVFSDTQPANTVIEEHQKAYFLQDRLLRPALVTVSKGSEEAESQGQPVEEQDESNNESSE